MRRIFAWGRDLQPRFERTRFGQGVISAVIVVIFACAIVWQMPNSPIRSDLRPIVRPIAITTGLDQNFGVFAPNPPRRLEYIDVQVTKRSGAVSTWQMPDWDPLFSHYWLSRWKKLKENLISTPSTRGPFLHWYARQVATPDDPVVRLRMVLRTAPIPAPSGAAPNSFRPATTVLYDEKLTGNP